MDSKFLHCRVVGLALTNEVSKLRVTVREGLLSVDCMLRFWSEGGRETQGDPMWKFLL